MPVSSVQGWSRFCEREFPGAAPATPTCVDVVHVLAMLGRFELLEVVSNNENKCAAESPNNAARKPRYFPGRSIGDW